MLIWTLASPDSRASMLQGQYLSPGYLQLLPPRVDTQWWQRGVRASFNQWWLSLCFKSSRTVLWISSWRISSWVPSPDQQGTWHVSIPDSRENISDHRPRSKLSYAYEQEKGPERYKAGEMSSYDSDSKLTVPMRHTVGTRLWCTLSFGGLSPGKSHPNSFCGTKKNFKEVPYGKIVVNKGIT